MKKVTAAIDIPIIASGGMGKLEDLSEAVRTTSVDAIAMAHVLHYDVFSIPEIRQYCLNENIPVRSVDLVPGYFTT